MALKISSGLLCAPAVRRAIRPGEAGKRPLVKRSPNTEGGRRPVTAPAMRRSGLPLLWFDSGR
jgi:hypothetical protein